MKTTVVAFASLIFLTRRSLVAGYPFGAGACPSGTAAVGGSHLLFSPTNGTLAEGALEVLLDGTPLVAGTPMDFEVGINHTLTVLRSAGTFRGLLFRLQTTDTLALSPQGDLQVSQECGDVPGITHTEASDKANASAILSMSSTSSGLNLDVTIVVQVFPSEFYYTGYVLNAVTSSSSGSTSPAPTPTSTVVAPTIPSSSSSVIPSSRAPTAATTPVVTTYAPSYSTFPSMNTPAPTLSMVPVAATIMAPSLAPVAAPAALPASTTSSASVARLDFCTVALLLILMGAMPVLY